jgi:integrase
MSASEAPPLARSEGMPRRLPKFCVEDEDRHGNVRVYLRRKGRAKVRLPGLPWSPEFMAAYHAALAEAADPPPRGPQRPADGTWRWLCVEYFTRSTDYLRLEPATRKARRQILEGTFAEPIRPNASLVFADMPIASVSTAAATILRDCKLASPQMGNARVKAMRAVFRWAVAEKLAKTDPAAAVPYFKVATEGHHTWSRAEVLAYQRQHPLGTTARLALALLLYTGVRRSDVVRLGRQHLADGWLMFTATKNAGRRPMTIEIPVLPALQEAIDATKTGNLTFLMTRRGGPYTPQSFADRFKDWCREAGLPPHCTAHGLRKAGATIAAEGGATEHQLMAIFGWCDPKMAAHYTRRAGRKRLAADAMQLIRIN